MSMTFSALSENEAFARVAVAAFVAQLNPTLEELTEIKTVVSEAVTNCIIHGYGEIEGDIYLQCKILGDSIELVVEDHGIGIDDLDLVRQPLYTSRPELERSGMGFTIMESFVDEFAVESVVGKGTKLRFKKRIRTPQSATHHEV
ncbi:anti-sigma F factor [Sulfoacidibacillus thermotolerans]|uniref:Anti-sigma F factor n=1 Tax=Sulfoacidibacillus thermotolerans TaxID=1765684 RepID=A0A2U3D6W1_SULT2|nr:anti-sigma F factor [Sulfoacidibacillus thermotolerans]PWI57001.1 anti-sigma F factor [Sulfoacidibacillus thermotolerans]